MKKTISIIIAISILPLLAFSPARAELLNTEKQGEYNNNLNDLAVKNAGYNDQASLANIIGTVIQLALSLVGAIFLVLAFMAGYNWMQATGNEEKVKKAQATIRNLLIGLCLILVAYLMSSGLGGMISRLLLKN